MYSPNGKVTSSIDQCWIGTAFDIKRDGTDLGSRAGGCSELLGYQFRMRAPWLNILSNRTRKFSKAYAVAELCWYLGGLNQIRWLTPYAPSYVNFSDDGETAYGAYGPRGLSIRHLERVCDILNESPGTRQAVTVLWDPTDIMVVQSKGSKDIPCTVSLKFYVRDNKVHLIADMRSNDVWLGLPYDAFCFTAIQMLVAGELGLGVGSYTHQAGSMHLYDRNARQMTDACAEEFEPSGCFERERGWDLDWARKLVSKFKVVTQSPNDFVPTGNTLVDSMLMACARRLNPELPEPHLTVWR